MVAFKQILNNSFCPNGIHFHYSHIIIYVQVSVKIKDAKKHSQGGILPKFPNAATNKKNWLQFIY